MTLAESLDVPLPDDAARTEATERLARLDLPGAGFGLLADPLAWAAGTQRRGNPAPFATVRVVLLAGDHHGDIAAGADPEASRRRALAELAGNGPVARLAARTGAMLELVDVGLAGPALAAGSDTRIRDGAAAIETEDACTEDESAAGFALGRKLADSLADSGADLLVVAGLGAGLDAAAAAAAAYLTGAEGPALLARVTSPGGAVDDAAWMRRCAALRDALARLRHRPTDPHAALTALGGPTLAAATGLVLGAAERRTPVLLDGPVGLTAALLARDLAAQVTHWCLAPDTSRHPTAAMVARRIGLESFLDLRLDLGEGAAALTGLGVLQSALALAHHSVPARATAPVQLSKPDDESASAPGGEAARG